MAEAEAVCDRVALIDHGRLLAVETPSSLARLVSPHERVDFDSAEPGIVATVRALPGVASVLARNDDNSQRVDLVEGSALRSVLETLVAAGVTSIRTSRPSLEEAYVHTIGDRGLKV